MHSLWAVSPTVAGVLLAWALMLTSTSHIGHVHGVSSWVSRNVSPVLAMHTLPFAGLILWTTCFGDLASLSFFFWGGGVSSPSWVSFSSFTRFLDHTRPTKVDRTPPDEWQARRRDIYLPTHNTHDRHPCLRWDSNPQSQQASGRRSTP
jgi:hypothetical protein